MANPIVSIVVPTYNRYKYLYDCVKSLLSINSDEIEFIIQDNTEDNKEFLNYIKSIDDPRLKYYHKKEHVSVVENNDMSVSHATGDYICMIGDDDTVCNNIVKAAHLLKDNNIDGCCFPFPGFNWPDMTFESGHPSEKNMFFRVKIDGTVTKLDSKLELKKNISKGDLGRLPRLYHALVSRECVNRIYEKTGSYNIGPSCDMAHAVATCLEADKCVYLNDNLIVSGYGRASARGEGNRNEHFGKIEDKPWLPKDTLKNWNPDIPPIFSGETIIAQSAWYSLKRMGEDRNYKFDYSDLYATFFWHHKNVAGQMLLFIAKSPKRWYWFGKGVVRRIIMKIKKEGRCENNILELDNVNNLMEAKEITEKLSEGIDYKMI